MFNKVLDFLIEHIILIAFIVVVGVVSSYCLAFYCGIVAAESSWKTCRVLTSIFPSDFFDNVSLEHADWGTFGDFVGGTLNPILSFLALIVLLRTYAMQREELKKTEETQKRQQFENTFFELLKIHNEALVSLGELKIKHINEQIFLKHLGSHQDISDHSEYSLNTLRNMAKKTLQKENYACGHYFRILYQLLKFISIASDNGITETFDDADIEKDDIKAGEKMYSNIVRALLTNDVMKLLAINCFSEKNDKDNYWKYKLLIERYELFQHASFSDDNGTHRYLQCAEKFYTPKAFGK